MPIAYLDLCGSALRIIGAEATVSPARFILSALAPNSPAVTMPAHVI